MIHWVHVFAAVDRDRITSRLIYGNKKTVLLNLPLEGLAFIPFVTFWKLIRSLAVTPRWLDDAKELIQPTLSKQHDCCSHKIPAADAGRFESCISRKVLKFLEWLNVSFLPLTPSYNDNNDGEGWGCIRQKILQKIDVWQCFSSSGFFVLL